MRFTLPVPLQSQLILLGCGSSGVGGGASFSGLLDGYTSGLAGAWCVAARLLASYTGPLIRVRRSSDNAESDIDADGDGILDLTALAAFVGANSAYVVKVYDQVEATADWDLTETTAANQLRLVDTGVVETLGTEGLPCMLSDITDGMRTPEKAAYTGTALSALCFTDRVSGAQTPYLGWTKANDRVDTTSGSGGIRGSGSGMAVAAAPTGGTAVGINNGSVTRTHVARLDGTNVKLDDRATAASTAHSTALNVTRHVLHYYTGTSPWEVATKWNCGVVWESALSNGDTAALITAFDTFFGHT